MGQSKGGGYIQKDILNPQQQTLLSQILSQAQGPISQASQGYAQFLPGGGGGEAIKNAAQRDFQQYTIPSILNTFGSNVKGSSALNQALAAGAANLNTDVSSQLAKMMLEASHGAGQLGTSQAQLGLGTSPFAFLQRQQPFWQSLLLGGLPVGGQLGSAFIGAPRYNLGLNG